MQNQSRFKFKSKLSIITLLICSISPIISAQEQEKVIYVQYSVTKARAQSIEKLYAKSSIAVYTNHNTIITNTPKKNIKKYKKINNYQVNISLSGPKTLKYYLKGNSNVVYFIQQRKEKLYLVRDELPEVKWNLDYSETKKIAEFECKKATTRFRGSKIVAWYAPQIPIPFGPWKFKGLPGLILEVYLPLAKFVHHWSAQKIVYPSMGKTDFTPPSNLKTIPYKNIVAKQDKKIEEMMKRRRARLPEGVKISGTKRTRGGVEKVFEWEK